MRATCYGPFILVGGKKNNVTMQYNTTNNMICAFGVWNAEYLYVVKMISALEKKEAMMGEHVGRKRWQC